MLSPRYLSVIYLALLYLHGYWDAWHRSIEAFCLQELWAHMSFSFVGLQLEGSISSLSKLKPFNLFSCFMDKEFIWHDIPIHYYVPVTSFKWPSDAKEYICDVVWISLANMYHIITNPPSKDYEKSISSWIHFT